LRGARISLVLDLHLIYVLALLVHRTIVPSAEPIIVILNQCLNNAYQALYNMFELFKEAGREIGEGAYMKKDDYIKKF
jgi:hypothetical protein